LQLVVTGGAWLGPQHLDLPIPYFGNRTTQLFAKLRRSQSTASNDILFQSQGRMLVLSIERTDGGVDVTQPAILGQVVQLPYLVPFDGFDHLSTALSERCPALALGVGLFPQYAGKVPRKLQLVTFDADRYTPVDIATGYDDVTTFAVILPEPQGHALVGIVGTTGSQTMFGLWEMIDCGQLVKVSERPIEFDWRTPPAPQFGDPPIVPKTNGVKLVAAQVGEEFWFAHYDGWDVRLLRANRTMTAWSLVEEKYNVHQDRQDLSFGFPAD